MGVTDEAEPRAEAARWVASLHTGPMYTPAMAAVQPNPWPAP
jgi:hypothetical protein